MVGVDSEGQLSIPKLEKVFKLKYEEGFRRFLIVPTVGSCLMGSIDPIKKIADFIRTANKETNARFYMHIDASFAGFTVPFVNPNLEFGFSIPEVMSVTIDGDKMGRLPYPAGIFLCRKGLMSLVTRSVNYVRGNQDDTLSGSRSCLAQILAWYLYQAEGIEGQRAYVQACLKGRDELINLIRGRLPWVTILPYSPWVNFAPLIIDIENEEVPEDIRENGILAPYHLRSDFYYPDDDNECPKIAYKICIMPHNFPHLERFVTDLAEAKKVPCL